MSRVVICDFCGAITQQAWHLTPPKAGVDPYVDLCSLTCLAEWARDEADKADNGDESDD